jgi:hypothetical protein
VSQTQYVFVPTNRFVGRNVASVRIPAQQSAQIFRQTRPVTGFAVSGGIVRNMALPMETIERAAGGKIEARSIQAAGTAPRGMTAGTTRVAVVAPAREVRAAARPQASRASEPSREKHAQAPVDRESGSTKAPKGHDAPPAESRHQPAEAAAHEGKGAPVSRSQAAPRTPAPSRGNHEAAPDRGSGNGNDVKAHDGPPLESHKQTAEKPVEHRQAPPRPAEPAPKPKPNSGKDKPVEKDPKPDGEKP